MLLSRAHARFRIPVTLFAGPRGAGKARTLLSLLETKPAEERWTVIVEEPGNTLPEPGLLAAKGIMVRGAPYGCPCCSGNLTMRVALARAVRETRPQRMLVDLSWGAHLRKVALLFEDILLAETLFLTGVVVIVDKNALNPEFLPESLSEAFGTADAILVTGGKALPASAAEALLRACAGKRVAIVTKDCEIASVLEPRAAPDQGASADNRHFLPDDGSVQA